MNNVILQRYTRQVLQAQKRRGEVEMEGDPSPQSKSPVLQQHRMSQQDNDGSRGLFRFSR
ncbi:hypothetical protein J2Z69_003234 [Paenibacillus shirakamiensis]|uniref:Uncharacterized protein n=1 Tax=Paenibacillus shirakamiensis TaxID=1265935 RepID=A0ABS4JKD8_9BACL|nr:hypothetical protein [Paenibacillus shirakamiensis]MBP2002177.1 hypothetical protein [Paenibacillus shirakamiensis]